MTFIEAIKTCFAKYSDFNGRAARSEYWWFALFICLVSLALSAGSDWLSLAFGLGTLLPSIAVATRRLHDSNRSGWLQLLVIIPLVGWLILVYFLVQPAREPNRFGNPPLLESAA